MYQRSSHEPRYKQSTRAREPRHAESNEYSEVSSSSEEEESSDRCSVESEASVATQETRSYQESVKSLNRRSSPNKYRPVSRGSRRDQFTQKNLLSPFPSYWAPPVQKQVTGNTYYKVSNIMPISEERHSFELSEKSSTHTPKKNESHEENDILAKRSQNSGEKKWEQHKPGKEIRPSKIIQPEHRHRESSRKLLKPLVEDFSRTLGLKSSRKAKTSSREIKSNVQMNNCPDCIATVDGSKRKFGAGTASDDKEHRSEDVDLTKDIGDGKVVKNKGKEVKEKLVYVVEEEGKDPTKIETDIFSLNEILAIKKDLIELSEFAKKLKKLKEMKKDSESDQNKKNSCHCHPAEELLRDVNKRIEALEARQEELERKSHCSNRRGDPKISKKMTKPKTLSISPPKTPIVVNLSAATTVPSDPKTEMIETRAEGFACNSDIVNELMDIKTQLEKLEKKRMLKEVSKETMPLKETNLNKTKEHAIAVFSSKTYILTTENFDKTKNGKAIGEKTRKELTKENVVNWLKNVSLERTDNDMSVFLSADAKREESSLEQKKILEELKCQNCVHISKAEDFENQEPQKNRALENLERGVDMSITCFVKNQYTEESNQFGDQKKCIITSSGRFVAVLSKSSENFEQVPAKEPEPPPVSSPQRASPKIVHRSASNGSIPSTVLLKRQLKKLKSQLTRKKHRHGMRVIRSKSATTIVIKPEKTPQERKMKNVVNTTESSTTPSEKKHKEGKHEFLKRLEAQFMTLARSLGMVDASTTSYSYSELLATVDLETPNSKKWPENPTDNQIIMYTETKKKSTSAPAKKKPAKSAAATPAPAPAPAPAAPKKEVSCEEECRESRKKKKLEEQCKKLQEKIKQEEAPKPKKKPVRVVKKPPPKPPKPRKPPRHYHHHHCRSCLLIHPWHPPCKKRIPTPLQHRVKQRDTSEQERNITSSNTEISSQCTRETTPEAPTPPARCRGTRPISPIIKEHSDRCRKSKRRSGIMSTSLNLDQGLLKKFFRNIGRCYPRLSDKSIRHEKVCPSTPRRCPEHGSGRSGSEEKYCRPEPRPPPRRPPPPCRPACPPQQDSQHRRSLHFQGSPTPSPPPHSHPMHLQHVHSPDSPPRSPHPQHLQHVHSPDSPPRSPHPLHLNQHPHSPHPLHGGPHHPPPHMSPHHAPPHMSPHHAGRSPRHPRHHPREPHSPKPSRHRRKKSGLHHVARCECEFTGPFQDTRLLSSHSSFQPFELLDDGNRSKTSLRPRKNKKSKKNEAEFSKFNNQVYLVNAMTEDSGRTPKNLLCVCNKCGNVHRRLDKIDHRLVDQKSINRKLKRIDKYDPLLEERLEERLEGDHRREYDNYDDYNYHHYDDSHLGYKSDHYSDSKSEQLQSQDSHKAKAKTSKVSRKANTYDVQKTGHKSDQYNDLSYCQNCSQCESYKAKVTEKKDHYYDSKVGHYTDCSPRCCESIRSRDSSKKGETFPFLSFFSQICRLKIRKPEEDHVKPKKRTGCQCKEKFDRLETRMNEIERGLNIRQPEASTSRPDDPRAPPSYVTRPDLGPKPVLDKPDFGPRPVIDSRPDFGPRPGFDKPDFGPRPAFDRPDFGPRPAFDKPDFRGGRFSGDKHSKKLDKEQRKLEKKMQNTAWAYKKWDEIERRRRLKDLNRLKKLKVSDLKRLRDRDAAAFYYTINTPSMAPSVLNPPPEDKKLTQSKSSFHFPKKISDGLSSLHSFWMNLRNHTFTGMGSFVPRMRRRSPTDSEVLIDDSSRSSQVPRTREVFETKDEPISFSKKHEKQKKSEKHKQKKEKPSPKSKSGKGRHR